MLSKLKEQFFGLTKVAGVEAILNQEGIVFNLLVLEKKKSLISIVSKEEGIKDSNELIKLIPKDTPVALCLNGRGIINRKIPDGTYKHDIEILSQVLPNAKVEDFYIQKIQSFNSIFISVIRKSTVDEVNSTFTSIGIPVISCSVGPFVLQSVLPFVTTDIAKVSLGNLGIAINNKKIVDFVPSIEVDNEEIKIGDDILKVGLIIAYSVAIDLFIHPQANSIESASLKFQMSEFKNKLLFQKLGYGFLGFFVFVLLVNYLFYSYYKGENARLSSISTSYLNTLDEVKKLEAKISEKEYFMKKAGWLTSPRTSFFSDEIASSIPASIKLSEIKVNPINDKLTKKERKDIFKSDTIIVAGECRNPTALNPWMNAMKEKEWVQSLSNINYSYDQKSGSGNFEIEIRINNEF
jgi:hypothetical protein